MASAAEQLAANMSLSAFRTADELKKRIWFTLGALLVYRLGTYIPLPGIDPQALQAVFSQQQSGIVGMFNMFAGATGISGCFQRSIHDSFQLQVPSLWGGQWADAQCLLPPPFLPPEPPEPPTPPSPAPNMVPLT